MTHTLSHAGPEAHLTAALAREHQADLLREAAQRRLARSVHPAPRTPARHPWWRRLLLPVATPTPASHAS